MRLLVFVILGFCLACGDRTVEVAGELPKETVASKYCDNQLALLSATEDYPIIYPDFTLSGDSLLSKISDDLGVDICNTGNLFRVPFDVENGKIISDTNATNLNALIDLRCENWPIWCFKPAQMSILVNRNHQVLFNKHIVSAIDSLSNNLKRKYFSNTYYQQPNKVFTRLRWDSRVNQNFMLGIVSNCIDGFLLIADSLSVQQFGESVCDLSPEELIQLKSRKQFSLWFDLQDYESIMPPPPPNYRSVNMGEK